MTEIVRSQGSTESERYLAELADRTFLDLWSYPNIFFAPGKELCDLLVICGDDVIVFSDKTIEWPAAVDEAVAWTRWYRKAVAKSAAQAHGAARRLDLTPDDIFLDAACTNRLPLDLPPATTRRIHTVVVALGAEKALADARGRRSGFAVAADVRGADHEDAGAPGFEPFAIGDVTPDRAFVHVFDRAALDLLIKELSTVSDFVRYLDRRAHVVRSQTLYRAEDEADLLACFIQGMDGDDEHDFVAPDGSAWRPGQRFSVQAGTHAQLVARPEYRAKVEADRVSYFWDRLINQFTGNILRGAAVPVVGDDVPAAAAIEPALRLMAREPRFMRRVLGRAFADAMEEAERLAAPRFSRSILRDDFAYVLLILAHPGEQLDGDAGYERYRHVRAHMLRAYCQLLLRENRQLRRAVGIAMDASPKVTGRQGGSEELLFMDIEAWTPELDEDTEALRRRFDIKPQGERRLTRLQDQEFPDVDGAAGPMSRQQRRAFERAERKARGRR